MPLLFLQQWIPGETLHALGWTFLHSLWQGLLAAMLAAIVMMCTRKASARVRYHLLCAVLLCFVVATGITFIYHWQQPASVAQAASAGSAEVTSVIVTGYTAAPAEEVTFFNQLSIWIDANMSLIMIVWALFFVMNCLKLFTGLASVRRLRQYRTKAVPAGWEATLQQLSDSLGIRQKVTLLQSALVKVPVALGVLRPVILVPVGLLMHLPPEQAETILLHELAHIKRKDYLVNLLQRIAEAIFFFNPALLWISSLIRLEREVCCDDVVLSHTPQRRNYVEALVAFQEYTAPLPAYALGISNKRQHLLERVKRIITRENRKAGWPERLVLLVGVMLLMAFTVIKHQAEIREDVKQQANATKQFEKNGQQLFSQPLEGVITVANKLPVDQLEIKKTAILIEPARQLRLSSNYRRNNTLSKLVYRDTPRVKIPVMTEPVKGMYRIMDHSTHVERNGKSKEIIKAIGSDGKNYFFLKENGKYKKMNINGKPVKEDDFHKYADLLQAIDKELVSPANRLPGKEEWEKANALEDKIKQFEKDTKKEMKEVEDKIKEAEKQHKTQTKELGKQTKNLEQQNKNNGDGDGDGNDKKKEPEKKRTNEPRIANDHRNSESKNRGYEPRVPHEKKLFNDRKTNLFKNNKSVTISESQEENREAKSEVKIESQAWKLEQQDWDRGRKVYTAMHGIKFQLNNTTEMIHDKKMELKFDTPIKMSPEQYKPVPVQTVEVKSPPAPGKPAAKGGETQKPKDPKKKVDL